MDHSFVGYVGLGDTLKRLWQARDNNNVPTAATGSVTYRVYSDSGLMTNGTGTAAAFDSANVTGVYQVSHAILGADGYARGSKYEIRVSATVSAAAKAAILVFEVR